MLKYLLTVLGFLDPKRDDFPRFCIFCLILVILNKVVFIVMSFFYIDIAPILKLGVFCLQLGDIFIQICLLGLLLRYCLLKS